MSTLSQGRGIRRIAVDAMLIALAMMLSYLEVLLPLQALIPIPGFRLGLANIVVMLTFCLISPLDAALVSGARITLMGLLFGSATSLYFSALGGLFAFLSLLLMKYFGKGCSFLGVSVISAAAHNAGQILAASTLFGFSLATTYLPLLLVASTIYGGIVGILVNLLYPRLQRLPLRWGAGGPP